MKKHIAFLTLIILVLSACTAPRTPTAAPEFNSAPMVKPTSLMTNTLSPTLAPTSKPLPTLTPSPTATNAPTLTPPPATTWAEAWLSLIGKQVTGAAVGRDDNGPLVAAIDSNGTLSAIRWVNGAWAQVWSTSESKYSSNTLLLADLDGDRKLELILRGKRLSFYKPTGLGFSLVGVGAESPIAGQPTVVAADLNQDGRKEVVSLVMTTDKSCMVTIYQVQPDKIVLTGSLEIAAAYGVALAAGELSTEIGLEILVGDANGQLLLLSSTAQDGKLKLLKKWNTIDDGGAVGYALQIADIDRDGVVDVVRGSNGGKLSVYHIDKSLNLTTAAQMTAGRLSYYLDLVDVNNDSMLEIVLGRGEDGYAGMTAKDVVVEAYTLKGKTFNRLWSLQTLNQPRPTVLDLDGDGRLEVFVYSQQKGTFTILRP